METSTQDNKLHILPCFNELLWKKNFGSKQLEPEMDKENIPARPTNYKVNNGNLFVNVESKYDLPTNPATKRYGKQVSTYNGILNIENCYGSTSRSGHKRTGIDTSNHAAREPEIWKQFCTFIKTKEKQGTQLNIIVTSHHNVLKQIIFHTLFKDDNLWGKYNIANCSCLKIENKNGIWEIRIIVNGYKDKDKDYLDTSLNSIKIGSYNNYNSLKNLKQNTCIYILRHGNSLHNEPLGYKGFLGIRRTIDTCLTPLGIWQARQTGSQIINDISYNNSANNPKIILCASELNRSQHTSLEIFHDFQTSQTQLGSIHNDLVQLKKLFAHMALRRLVRKLTQGTILNIQNKEYYEKLKKCILILTEKSIDTTPHYTNLLALSIDILIQYCNDGESEFIPTDAKNADYIKYNYVKIPTTSQVNPPNTQTDAQQLNKEVVQTVEKTLNYHNTEHKEDTQQLNEEVVQTDPRFLEHKAND